ncbi:CARDB domain-containing protein [Salinigranum salinum]|uniref:CARDB domain-containing protein n=1 Tax=Salinigranum salinum TaxID=1364937 RepID=UPI001260EFE5|nr:CARDB domain-containing protein [Salinigranum salinum]
MSSRFAVVLTLLLLVGSIAGAMPAVAVPDARLTVSGVAVTPGTPVTGAPVTVTVTVSNGGGSPEALAVDEIRLVEDGDVVARSVDPGSLSAGGTLTVPLTARFADPGQHDLTIQVRGRDEDDTRVEVRRPLSLVVESAPPLVELNTTDLVVDSETAVPVVVSNPTTDTMRNVVVSLSTANGEAIVDRRTVASLAAGAETGLDFTVRAAAAGDATLTVRVDYTTGSGTRATETFEHPVRVAELDDDIGVRVETAPTSEEPQQPAGQLGVLLGGNAGQTTRDGDGDDEAARVEVTVTNFGNAPIEDVVATPRVGETTLARVGVPGPLGPGEEASVIVPLERAPGGDLVVDVTYTVGSGEGTATGQFDFRPQTGAVRVTGVDLVAEDGVVRVTGNAGNVGRGSVTGVVLAVGSAAGVEPAYPQRDYFVGTVEGSEFAPFELTARVDEANATAIPVVVTYAVDGDVREERLELPLRDDLGSEESSDRQLPLSIWLGVVGVAAVAAGAVVVVRRR